MNLNVTIQISPPPNPSKPILFTTSLLKMKLVISVGQAYTFIGGKLKALEHHPVHMIGQSRFSLNMAEKMTINKIPNEY